MSPPTGLRERKKRAAMRRIQTAALDLFDASSFAAVTIEQIAEAAEVSPSSVYRYFGTKEQLLLWDDYDPDLMADMARFLEDHPPVSALRLALRANMSQVFERDEDLVRRRLRYVVEEPALQAAGTEQIRGFAGWAAVLLAEHTGRQADDLEVAVIATSLVSALEVALRHWHAGGYARPLAEEFDRAFAVLERGLTLP